jgi:hypothetical protein
VSLLAIKNIQEGYSMKYQGWYCPIVFLSSAAILLGCGRSGESEEVNSQALQTALKNHLGESTLSNPGAQAEIREVTDEIQTALAKALIPEYSTVAGRATNSGCAPQIHLVFIGLSIDFQPSANCHLSGSIAVTAFPMKATANLNIVGLQFLQKLEFTATVVLGSGLAGSTMNIIYENATYSLAAGAIRLVSSGAAALAITAGGLQVDSRINVFESSTGLGVALMAKLNPASRTFQSCLLTSGSATDPQGGTLGACFRI